MRQLYSDDEEVLFQAARPILLNGIEDVISRPDLGDRAIFLSLGPIGEERRRSETELWREFERARPSILGALLDAAAHGLMARGCVHLHRLPRMADFELPVAACVREIMSEHSSWTGSAADLLRVIIERTRHAIELEIYISQVQKI